MTSINYRIVQHINAYGESIKYVIQDRVWWFPIWINTGNESTCLQDAIQCLKRLRSDVAVKKKIMGMSCVVDNSTHAKPPHKFWR